MNQMIKSAGLAIGLALAGAAAGQPLTLAVGLAKPPYIEDDARHGLELELARAAFRAAGRPILIRQMPQARGLEALRLGQVDAMLTLTAQSAPGGLCSTPLVHYRNRAITLANRSIELTRLEDLAAYRLASFQNARLLFGPAFDAIAQRAPFYAEYGDQATLNRMLVSGRVEVVLGDEWVFRAFAAGEPNAPKIRVFPLFADIPRCVAFHDAAERDAFNQGLAWIARSGEAQRIRYRYQRKYRLPELP